MEGRPLNSVLAYIVVCCQALLAIICVCAICAAMFYKNYSDPATLSALFLLTGTLVGNLGSILGGPRSMMQQPAGTETTVKQTTETVTTPKAQAKPDEPIPVTIENPPDDPANVKEVKP